MIIKSTCSGIFFQPFYAKATLVGCSQRASDELLQLSQGRSFTLADTGSSTLLLGTSSLLFWIMCSDMIIGSWWGLAGRRYRTKYQSLTFMKPIFEVWSLRGRRERAKVCYMTSTFNPTEVRGPCSLGPWPLGTHKLPSVPFLIIVSQPNWMGHPKPDLDLFFNWTELCTVWKTQQALKTCSGMVGRAHVKLLNQQCW